MRSTFRAVAARMALATPELGAHAVAVERLEEHQPGLRRHAPDEAGDEQAVPGLDVQVAVAVVVEVVDVAQRMSGLVDLAGRGRVVGAVAEPVEVGRHPARPAGVDRPPP